MWYRNALSLAALRKELGVQRPEYVGDCLGVHPEATVPFECRARTVAQLVRIIAASPPHVQRRNGLTHSRGVIGIDTKQLMT